MVGAFVLLDIILLSLWTGIEPMHTGHQQFDDKVLKTTNKQKRAETATRKKTKQNKKKEKKNSIFANGSYHVIVNSQHLLIVTF